MPRQPDVDDWFARYDNPMKAVVMRIRDIVLGADKRIDGAAAAPLRARVVASSRSASSTRA